MNKVASSKLASQKLNKSKIIYLLICH